MFYVFLNFFLLFYSVYGMKIENIIYYSSKDCEDNFGQGPILFSTFATNSIGDTNCTNLDNYLYAKSMRKVYFESDNFPAIEEAVPYKSQYYTVYVEYNYYDCTNGVKGYSGYLQNYCFQGKSNSEYWIENYHGLYKNNGKGMCSDGIFDSAQELYTKCNNVGGLYQIYSPTEKIN